MTTDARGNALFTLTLVGRASNVTATATDASGNTSEEFGVQIVEIAGEIGTQVQVAEHSDLNITDSNVYAIPQSSGVISLTADGLSPNVASVLSLIHWAVQRNKNDVVTGALPTLTSDPSDPTNPLEGQLALNAVGSFNAICYVDVNNDGKYEPGEEIKVFNIAEVSVKVTSSIITASSANWTITDNGTTVSFNSGDFTYNDPNANPVVPQSSAMLFETKVQLQGGGADGTLGISQIHLGWLQNLTGGSVTTTYPGNHTETYSANHPTPLLDTGLAGTGGSTDFLSRSTSTSVNNDPTQFEITAVDSPGLPFDDAFPATGAAAMNTSGTLSFACALAAFSDSYNAFYAPSIKVIWSLSFNLSYANVVWSNTGAKVTDTSNTVLPNPTTMDGIGIVTTGPTALNSFGKTSN